MTAKKGHKVSEATRKKIRDKLKGRKISDEARKNRIGRKLSLEHRRNIGLASKGRKHSEETKRKMRGKKHSEATKRKLSEARKGAKNPMYGKRHSEEHRRKISEANKGKKISEEHKKKLRLANIGKKPSEETRRKIGLAHLGKKLTEEHKRKIGRKGKLNKNYGKHLSEETKRKMSKALKGRSVWNKGKTGIYSEETRRKMGESKKGKKRRPFSEETRKRMSESKIGIKFSEKSKERMSIAKKKLFASGYVHPMKGTKLSPERRREMSLARKGKKYAPGRISGMKGKKHSVETRRKISSGLKGHITTEETRKRIGAKNKITAKRFWESMTKSQKQNSALAKNWFVKGQVSHNKGKKASITTRKKQSRSATIRFQTQKHPHQGTHRSEKTKRLLREARLRQKPTKDETWPEKFAAKMLKKEKITFEKQKSFRNPPCIADLYIEPKICVFLDGDYWHCNPNDYVYKKKLNPGFKPNDQISGKKYAKDVWVKDKKITRGLRKKGYSVLRFWQSELETEKEKCLQKIIKAIK